MKSLAAFYYLVVEILISTIMITSMIAIEFIIGENVIKMVDGYDESIYYGMK